MRRSNPPLPCSFSSIDRGAAMWAGIIAGVLATLAQGVMWWIFIDDILNPLLRDTQLTAALVMGEAVLPPPIRFSPGIMIVAAAIHFVLSIFYAMLLAWAIHRQSWGMSLLTGVVFGLAIYVLNLYGLTLLFPWFTEVRDGITLAAHLVFGITAAGAYQRLARR